MYSYDELKGLHGFLRATGEGNLKKMLVGGHMTEVHLRVLLKVARTVDDVAFATHWEAGTFPKVKMSPEESALKETLYIACGEACAKVGLLTGVGKTKAA
jgi:hypothetical protein